MTYRDMHDDRDIRTRALREEIRVHDLKIDKQDSIGLALVSVFGGAGGFFAALFAPQRGWWLGLPPLAAGAFGLFVAHRKWKKAKLRYIINKMEDMI